MFPGGGLDHAASARSCGGIMNSIRAFVGHSFAQSDEKLVRTFLDYFQSLAKAQPEFTWDHAEDAEPIQLAKKVLDNIDGKNVFIGICTKKERAISDDLLSATWFGKRLGNTADFSWKTSDWIIQEIGLAVGRGMTIVLFIENEVRLPGGLFGDVEYISFEKERLHEAFEKFLQMLSTLTPKDVAPPATGAKPVAANEPPSPIEAWEPQPDWPRIRYPRAAMAMLFDGNESGLNRIDAAYRTSPYAYGDGLPTWEAELEFVRYLISGKLDFQKLQRLASGHPHVSKITQFLARGYESLKEHELAAQTFERAASISKDNEEKLDCLSNAAIQYRSFGEAVKATALLESAKELAIKHEIKTTALIPEFKEFAKVEKNTDLCLAVMEHELSSQPDDIQARFQLAFKHSESYNADLALYHYLKIPTGQRDPMSWNNLGVSFGEFNMPVRSISAFRSSANEGETLAMSNLGLNMLQAGFLEEAREECKRALKLENPHKRLGLLLERLGEVEDEETKKLEEVLEKLKGKAEFYRHWGNAAFRLTPATVARKWHREDDVFDADLSDAVLQLVGTFTRPANVLAGLLGRHPWAQETYIQKVEYKLTQSGEMLLGTVTRSRQGCPVNHYR
jgi:tetratricopeptide (TPR) repeat protein